MHGRCSTLLFSLVLLRLFTRSRKPSDGVSTGLGEKSDWESGQKHLESSQNAVVLSAAPAVAQIKFSKACEVENILKIIGNVTTEQKPDLFLEEYSRNDHFRLSRKKKQSNTSCRLQTTNKCFYYASQK